MTYRKKQTCNPSHVFGKDHDKFVRIVACREGEPVCADKLLTLKALSALSTRPSSEDSGFDYRSLRLSTRS